MTEPRFGAVEEFLGGRVLAWAGAITVLLGVVFLVAVAIGRGWIGEEARIALGFGVSAAMLAGGAYLYERRGRTQAALALAGSGLAGLYLAVIAGTQLYDLYPALGALAEAFLIGTVGTVLALRWNSRTVAALAIGGALLAPALVGAEPTAAVAGFLLIALASAVGVLVMRRWEWLSVACFVIAAPQLLVWVGSEESALAIVLGLSIYAIVNAAAAFGYELRDATEGLRPSSTLLLVAGGLVAAAGGYFGLLNVEDTSTLANLWLAGLAAAHLGAGLWAVRSPRMAREVGLVAVGAGVVLADTAFGLAASGPVVGAGWAASAAGLGVLVRRRDSDVELTRLALGGQLMLALLHVLLFDADPGTLAGDVLDLPAALIGIGSIAITAFVCARLESRNEYVSTAFDLLAMAALAYACAFALDGPALVASWTGIGVAIAGLARREPLAAGGALGFLGIAGLHCIAVEHQPESLLYGSHDLGAAAAALGAFGFGTLAVARQLVPAVFADVRRVLRGVGAGTLLYLASLAIVTTFQPSADAIDTGLALSVRQQGQVLLSCMWALVGVVALVAGLRGRVRELRLAGLALLALAFAKVIVFDLSTLDSIYRVASCIVLGLLLLGSAFAYQRMRPGERTTVA